MGMVRGGEAGRSRIRLAIVSSVFPPDIGGPASYVPRLARDLVHRGHDVRVICVGHRAAGDSRYPFVVRRVRTNEGPARRVLQAVQTIARTAADADLIYANGLALEATLAGVIVRVPVAQKVVGDAAWERAQRRGWFAGSLEEYQRAPKRPGLAVLDRLRAAPLRRAHGIVVPSRYLAGIVAGWGVPRHHIRTIYNAVPPPPSTLPQRAPGRTIVMVNRLVPWKGVDAAIRLVARLPDTRLVVLGTGPLLPFLTDLARHLGVIERVLLLGAVEPAEVLAWLARSDVFLLNSSYEGLPHAVLEAMAAGTPVVATSAGGTPEVVEDGQTGLLVPVGDHAALQRAVETLLADPGLGSRLAGRAREVVASRFSQESMVDATERLLIACSGNTSPLAPAETIGVAMRGAP